MQGNVFYALMFAVGWFPWVCCAMGQVQDIPVVYYETQCSNIKGTLLVLDVGSLNPRDSVAPPGHITSADQCRKICGSVKGCNAWTYCTGTCGSGCPAFLKQVPALKSTTSGWVHGIPLPVTFGPYGNCSGDSYPGGMCSLKYVANTQHPDAWPMEKGVCSMTSGTIYTAPECGTASAESCELCAATSQFESCVQTCADRVSLDTVKLLTGTTNKYNDCSRCYHLENTSATAPCVGCLVHNRPCSYL